jgi:hypothetical protein
MRFPARSGRAGSFREAPIGMTDIGKKVGWGTMCDFILIQEHY